MRKNIAILLLGISTLALLALGIRQHRQLQDFGKEVPVRPPMESPAADISKALQNTHEEQPLLPDEERKEYEETIDRLESQLQASEAEASASDGKESAASPTSESAMAGIAEMMKNPGMKEMIRAQQKATMGISYGSLFKYLELSDEDMEAFKELLLGKQMALLDVSLGMMDGSTTAEERNEKGKHIIELTADFDEKIKALLGEDDYEVYQQFESTQQERLQVNFFKQSLSSADQLSEKQEHDLILAMYAERTNFQFSTNFEKPQEMAPGMFNENAITKHMEELSHLQEQYLSQASDILTTTQLEQFKMNLEQMRAMQEMGTKMAAQMFGQQGGSEPENTSSD